MTIISRLSPFLLCLLLLVSNLSHLNGQELKTVNFRSPLDIPLFLSGNFGEIRSNHFHSGLDFKTKGQSGLSVHAIERGFVSRIKVEPGGYGKAIYIQHPNGYSSLYGHLMDFRNDLAEYVKSSQYQRESFSVDLYPKPGQFSVEPGDYIALSGNTGSSQAPHLHFEIRDSQTQNPVNPLLFPFEVYDSRAPQIKSLYIYSLTGRKDLKEPLQISLSGSNGTYKPSGKQIWPIDIVSGIGVETIDFLDNSSNKCGIYELKIFFDDGLIFSSKMDEFSFSESKYINSLIDYRIYDENRKQVLKAFIEPNNSLSIYQYASNQGKIQIQDTLIHEIRVQINDVHLNKSEAKIMVRLNPGEFDEFTVALPYYSNFFSFSEKNHFEEKNILLEFPQNSFYDNVFFYYESDSIPPGAFSRIHRLHDSSVPLHRSFKLSIKPDSLPDHLKPYAIIARVSEAGEYHPAGGYWEEDYLVTKSGSFGDFTVCIDSIPPSIQYTGNLKNEVLRAGNSITFTIEDDFSGIKSFRGTLDGKWILFDWDPKTSTLKHKTDKALLPRGTQKELILRVLDRLGNIAEFKKTVTR